ncbi:MAG: helix-turn-helix domain-containing protein [bacterium]
MSQLGTILRNRREELNLTQAEVSRQTNIRVNIIDALEKGKNSILPATYLRSFSKSYWQFLRLPMEDFEKAFAESGIMPQLQEQSFIGTLINPEKEKEKEYTPPPPLKTIESPRYSPRLVSGVISAAMILILIVGVYYLFVKDIVDDTPVDPSSQTEVTIQEDKGSDTGGELLSIFEDAPSTDSIVLEVTAKNKTWFTINADGKNSESVVLESGQTGRWAAIEYFTLSVSNNGGVTFKRNGQVLPNIAKEGTIIREMKITATEVTNSAMPYKDIAETSEKEKVKSSKSETKVQSGTGNSTTKKTSESSKSKNEKVTGTTKKSTVTSSSSAKKSAPATQTKKKTQASPSIKKKTTTEKSKSPTKKKTSEKSKSSDKKKTASKSKETKKASKPTSNKKESEKKKPSDSKKVESPKPLPIGNPRR